MKLPERSLIQPMHMREPAPPAAQPVDLGFFIQIHQYLRSIPEPSETVRSATTHLEEQISKAILAINIRIGPAPT